MNKTKAYLKKHNNLLGALLVLIHALAVAVLFGLMKELRSELGINLIMFLYKFLLFLMILPFCLSQGGKAIRTKQLHLHILRALCSLGGGLSFFYAVKFIDLVDATAVGYLEQVLWAVIGMVYFAEKVSIAKITSVILSFLGALLVVYPEIITLDHEGLQIMLSNNTFKGFNHYYIFVFLAIILWAGNCTVVKLLGNTEGARTQLFYLMLLSSLLTIPTAFFNWNSESGISFLCWTVKSYSFAELGLKLPHISIILLLALCYFIHNITFFKALQNAELSAVVPFDYSRLVFTGLIGYVFFKETPVFGKIIGLLFIVSSGIYLIKTETRRVKNKTKQKELQIEYENT